MSDYTSAMSSAQHEANFIRNMKRIREERGWSQGEFARRMKEDFGWDGFHQTTISRIEKGERPVRLSESSGIAAALGALVNQMILPIEEAKALRDLELEIIQANSCGATLAESVEMYMFHQMNLRRLAELVEDQPLGPDADDVIIQRRETSLRQARAIISETYTDVISEYMERRGNIENDDESPDAGELFPK